jgi:hypothetical protein
MKKYLILLAPLLFFLSGCALFSSNIVFSSAQGFKDAKLSARSVPAKVTEESNTVLETKGYVYIGLVRLEDEVNSCWDKDCKDFKCTDSLPHKDMTKEVLEKAASHGGDLFVLESNAKLDISSTEKKSGPCVRQGDKYIQVSYCCKQGKGYCESTCYRTERRTVCLEQASIYGKKCSFVTSGKVWRHDPELIKYAQQIKEYDRVQNEYVKNSNDKYSTDKEPERFLSKTNYKYGFKDRNGKIVIPPEFEDASMLGWRDGLTPAAAGKWKEHKWGFIDKAGKWVIQPSYDAQPVSFQDGLAAASVNKKWGFINKKGIYVIEPQFMNADRFSEGLAAIAMDNKWGYINKKGAIVIKPQFRKAYPFSEGLAAIAVDKKWGYIDKQGNIAIGLQFDYAAAFAKGIAQVIVSNRWGYINEAGELLATNVSAKPDSTSFFLRLMNEPEAFQEDLRKGMDKALKNLQR